MFIIAIMINLSSGTRAIKNARPKKQIKDGLVPIAWHPDRVTDWCMSGDEGRWWK